MYMPRATKKHNRVGEVKPKGVATLQKWGCLKIWLIPSTQQRLK